MNIASHAPTIRRAAPDDAEALASLGAATFEETFGHLYPPEDLQTFLATAHSLDMWRHTLGDRHRAVWAAEHPEAGMIGFLVAGACKLPVKNLAPAAGEVQQLYVLARFHNLRIGARLMNAGLEWLATEERVPVYVGVWSENHGAQRFYARYGFRRVGEYGFPVGRTIDREFIMMR